VAQYCQLGDVGLSSANDSMMVSVKGHQDIAALVQWCTDGVRGVGGIRTPVGQGKDQKKKTV